MLQDLVVLIIKLLILNFAIYNCFQGIKTNFIYLTNFAIYWMFYDPLLSAWISWRHHLNSSLHQECVLLLHSYQQSLFVFWVEKYICVEHLDVKSFDACKQELSPNIFLKFSFSLSFKKKMFVVVCFESDSCLHQGILFGYKTETHNLWHVSMYYFPFWNLCKWGITNNESVNYEPFSHPSISTTYCLVLYYTFISVCFPFWLFSVLSQPSQNIS